MNQVEKHKDLYFTVRTSYLRLIRVIPISLSYKNESISGQQITSLKSKILPAYLINFSFFTYSCHKEHKNFVYLISVQCFAERIKHFEICDVPDERVS